MERRHVDAARGEQIAHLEERPARVRAPPLPTSSGLRAVRARTWRPPCPPREPHAEVAARGGAAGHRLALERAAALLGERADDERREGREVELVDGLRERRDGSSGHWRRRESRGTTAGRWQPSWRRASSAAAAALGATLDARTASNVGTWLERLEEWNARIDLTAARSPEELVDLMLADALVLAPRIAADARVVDVGTGAGAPGLALALLRPDLRVTLVEPLGKRAAFLRTVIGEAGRPTWRSSAPRGGSRRAAGMGRRRLEGDARPRRRGSTRRHAGRARGLRLGAAREGGARPRTRAPRSRRTWPTLAADRRRAASRAVLGVVS